MKKQGGFALFLIILIITVAIAGIALYAYVKITESSNSDTSISENVAVTPKAEVSGNLRILSPKNYDLFHQGEDILIAWDGGSGDIRVGLISAEGANKGAVYWISVEGKPYGSVVWNGKTACASPGNALNCPSLPTGNYKIFVDEASDPASKGSMTEYIRLLGALTS